MVKHGVWNEDTICYLPLTETEMVLLSLPIGLVTVHVYVPLSLVVTLLMV